jgi:DNA-binding NarL/FixJ family response regulator
MTKIRVIIVEDHLLTRVGLRFILDDSTNLKVIDEAEDGLSGFQKVVELVPDIALLDIGLPVIDGIECLTRIRQAKLPTRVMIRSSHAEDAAILAAIAAGADGYCLKDSPDQLLIAGLEYIHGGKAWLDPRIAGQMATAFSPYLNRSRQPSNGIISSSSRPSFVLDEADLATLNQIATSTDDSGRSEPLNAATSNTDPIRLIMQKISNRKI